MVEFKRCGDEILLTCFNCGHKYDLSVNPGKGVYFCFPEGTNVQCEKGTFPIEKINSGDKVLGSDGFFHNVTTTFKRPFTSSLVELCISKLHLKILET